MGLVRHHLRAGPGVEPRQDPDDDDLEGQRPSVGTLGHSGVERPPGLRMGLRRLSGPRGATRVLARSTQRDDREHEQGHQARAAGAKDAQGGRVPRIQAPLENR